MQAIFLTIFLVYLNQFKIFTSPHPEGREKAVCNPPPLGALLVIYHVEKIAPYIFFFLRLVVCRVSCAAVFYGKSLVHSRFDDAPLADLGQPVVGYV